MKKTRLALTIIAVLAVIVLGCLVIWWVINISGVREISDENKDLMTGVFVTEEPISNYNSCYFGEEKEICEMVFDTGVAGYSCFIYYSNDEHGLGLSDTVDEIFCEYSAYFDSNSVFERRGSVDATVYWSEECDLHIYPVYQNSDGQVYVVPEGEPISLKYSDGEDDILIKTYRDKTSEHINGEPFEITVNITFKKVDVIKEIKISQMSEDGDILKQDFYPVDNHPNEYAPEKNTDYLSVQMSAEGKSAIPDFALSELDRDDGEIKVYKALGNGLLTERYLHIDWE